MSRGVKRKYDYPKVYKLAHSWFSKRTSNFERKNRHGKQECERRMRQRSKLTEHQAKSMGWEK